MKKHQFTCRCVAILLLLGWDLCKSQENSRFEGIKLIPTDFYKIII